MLLSIVAVSAFTGLQMALRASALHHQMAVSETMLRTAAENLQNPDSPYVHMAGCPGQGSYQDVMPSHPGYGTVTAEVTFISPDTFEPQPLAHLFAMTPPTCSLADQGLQEIRLSVTTPSGHVQHLEVMKAER